MELIAVISLIVASTLHTSYGAATSNDAIKYPEPIHVDDDVPEACRNLTYCTIRPKNYPQETFNKMFTNYKPVPQPALVLGVSFENRQGDPNEEDDCASVVTFEPLYKVREKREDVWRTVVQAPDHDYVQRVRLETCRKEGSSCFNVFSGNSDFVTFCKQKYNTWEVLVYKGNNETEKIEARLPVCCSCHYKAADMA